MVCICIMHLSVKYLEIMNKRKISAVFPTDKSFSDGLILEKAGIMIFSGILWNIKVFLGLVRAIGGKVCFHQYTHLLWPCYFKICNSFGNDDDSVIPCQCRRYTAVHHFRYPGNIRQHHIVGDKMECTINFKRHLVYATSDSMAGAPTTDMLKHDWP